MRCAFSALVLAVATACAPASPPPAPAPARQAAGDPAPAPAPAPSTPPLDLGVSGPGSAAPGRVAPPVEAWKAGWMPVDATSAGRFVERHPDWDGRGVLIAILDSGLDPTIPGLDRTTGGERKVLDLRDMSGEGRVPLTRVALAGTRLPAAADGLDGAVRLRGFASGQAAWVGHLSELALGPPPASDLDGNGVATDSLVLVVVRGAGGWLLFADTDRDGSLANERPVRDYAVAGETFCWQHPPAGCPVAVAANLGGAGDEPELSLVFDTSGHGSHVAGIAAGNDLYGVAGFDGVAPGAWLLGYKIADNANGGISTTGSMRAALAHAVTAARARHAPLVVNLSFGIGNDREGRARIDAVVDSVLAANPDVVMTVSAGNDGPGLSTVGFPGSAARPISVGATFPVRFVERGPEADRRPDPVAYFSARGGELAKPDVVTPGIAYSTVPAWDMGQERNAGTSMAAPHAAGLAALLVSALHAEGRTVEAWQVRQSLMATARPTPGATWLDEGAGLPDVELAWAWLSERRDVPRIEARAPGGSWGLPGIVVTQPQGTWRDTTVALELRRTDAAEPVDLVLSSDMPWVAVPHTVQVGAGPVSVPVRVSAGPAHPQTMATALVTARSRDARAGGLLRLPVTALAPVAAGSSVTVGGIPLAPGGVARLFFAADSGHPFEASVTSEAAGDIALSSLHGPGGFPYPGDNGQPAGAGDRLARYPVEGGEVWPGVWELVAVPPPGRSGKVSLSVRRSPVRLAAQDHGDRFEVELQAAGEAAVVAEPGLILVGTTTTIGVSRSGGDLVQLPLELPAWAVDVQVDATVRPGDWERFTDLGITLVGGDGHQVEHTPLSHRRGRLTTPLGAEVARRGAALELRPGLADADDDAPWEVTLSVRLYAAEVVEPRPLEVWRAEVAPGQPARAAFERVILPWELAEGWRPLAVAWAQTADGLWTAEGALEARP